MSQKEHTRGPWWSPDGKTIKQDYRPLTEIGGCIIAGVMGGSTSGPFFIEDDEEVAANTRLVVASPDLLEALEELRELMQGVIDGDYAPDSFTLQVADKAIAKARGEQP